MPLKYIEKTKILLFIVYLKLKKPKNLIYRIKISYIYIRRSLAITRWIRNIQVAFLRSVSDNIARSAALYSSQSREVVDSILTNMPNTGINP